jgi:dTDP-4-amino-4,6-dideoxygalactose transaminase
MLIKSIFVKVVYHNLLSGPQAEFLGRQGIHVGVHHGLELADMEYVLDTIRRFLELHQS